MAMAINAQRSSKQSGCKQGGRKASTCSLGTAKVRTRDLSKNASTAKGWFFKRENISGSHLCFMQEKFIVINHSNQYASKQGIEPSPEQEPGGGKKFN